MITFFKQSSLTHGKEKINYKLSKKDFSKKF